MKADGAHEGGEVKRFAHGTVSQEEEWAAGKM